MYAMNQREQADLFNQLLNESKTDLPDSKQGDMQKDLGFARQLEQVDFSEHSTGKELLRLRLLAQPAETRQLRSKQPANLWVLGSVVFILLLMVAISWLMRRTLPETSPQPGDKQNQIQTHVTQAIPEDTPRSEPATTSPESLIVYLAGANPPSGIYKLSAGTNPFRILSQGNTVIETNLDVSPDGNWVVFSQVKTETNQADLFTIRSNGSGLTQLTTTNDTDLWPRWSPDGKYILFTRLRGQGIPEIYRISAHGGEAVSLTDGAEGSEPVWSPDGNWIYFTTFRDANPEVYRMAADGSQAKNISNNQEADYRPIPSPDGLWVAFNSGDNQARVRVWQAHSGEIVEALESPLQQEAVAWSADGRYLAIEARGGGIPENSIKVFIWDTLTQTARELQANAPDLIVADFFTFATDGRQAIVNLLNPDTSEVFPRLLNLNDGSFAEIPGFPAESSLWAVYSWGKTLTETSPETTQEPDPTTIPLQSYTVQAGDTCLRIAMQWNIAISQLIQANDLAPDCSNLTIGQVLKIPTVSPRPTTTNVSIPKSYTVQEGDTCQGIAAQWNSTLAELIHTNNLNPDCSDLTVGQVLRLPEPVP
jgi:Tol biopolymer transport system component/LysM repeat protein